jgi:photosystem II Psb27 protein
MDVFLLARHSYFGGLHNNLEASPFGNLSRLSMMFLSLTLVSSAAAFSPWAGPMHVIDRTASAVQMSAANGPMTRRGVVAGAFAAFVGVLPSFAEDDYKLKKDYPTDARTLLKNMELATELARGAPNMETIVKSTRSEMNDFVAFYRRQPKVAGMPSFSTLYTAVNTLSGHYASYGNKYPVPEKRKVSRRARSLAWGVPAVCFARHSPPLLTLAVPVRLMSGAASAAVQGDRACACSWQVIAAHAPKMKSRER